MTLDQAKKLSVSRAERLCKSSEDMGFISDLLGAFVEFEEDPNDEDYPLHIGKIRALSQDKDGDLWASIQDIDGDIWERMLTETRCLREAELRELNWR